MWRVCRIDDLGEINRGKSKHRPRNDARLFGGKYPFIQTGDVKKANLYINEYNTTYSEFGLAQSKLWPKDTLCITIAANIAESAILGIDACFPDSVVGFVPKKNKADLKFVKYLLDEFKVYMQQISKGTTQDNLSLDKLRRVKFYAPDYDTQVKIAKVISVYDDLIENNNKRIKILEQMAENLYKEWFICFRFPGYESSSFVASSIGRIPEGFSVLKMQDVINYHIGGGWGSDVRDKNFECEAFVIRGTDFPYVKEGILSTCPRRYHKINNYRTRKLEEGDIILEVSGGTAEQPVGRALLVTKDTLRRFGRKLICASFCKLVRLKRNIISPYYFIYWMNFLYSTRIIEKFQLQSTGIINFKFEYFFKKGDILLPPVDLMHIFVGKIKTIKAQIDKLAEVNENLTKQRDMLLPRLMSGKLEV